MRGADIQKIGTARQHSCSIIQTRVGLELVRPAGAAVATASTSPRLTSTSSARVTVIDWPTTASVKVAVQGHQPGHRALAARGSTRARSPGAPEPPTTRPEKPRNSWSRPCPTARASGRGAVLATLLRSRRFRGRESSVGPLYQGVCTLGLGYILPPEGRERDADDVVDSKLGRRTVSKSAADGSKASWAYPTRSSLLTRAPRDGMSRSETRKLCRRVWVITPARASTRMRAGSAVDAPVTMFHVYCSWPGVSATMNFRRSVEKKR